jgi:capsule polysaccharide export protein KpsE/RkpR
MTGDQSAAAAERLVSDISTLEQAIAAQRKALKTLRAILGPDAPKILQKVAEIAELEARLDSARARDTSDRERS